MKTAHRKRNTKMRDSYDYREAADPHHWDSRTPLYLGMPRIFHLYQDMNDKKVRVFLSKLGGRILEVGCGEGRFTAYATVGVDFSKGMLQRARRRHSDRNFVRASILNLPFRDKSFSSAFTVDVINHISPERQSIAINELHRVAERPSNFVAEDRTSIPSLLQRFGKIRHRIVKLMVPYLVVPLAFFLDRFKELEA